MIRKAIPSDKDAIWQVISAAAQWLVENYNSRHWADWYKPEVIKHKLVDTDVYVYEIDGKVVGCYSLSDKLPSYYDEDPNFDYKPKPKSISLGMLGVDPNMQGQGIGKELMNHVEVTAKSEGYEYMIFDTNDKITSVVEFYHRLGYVEVAELIEDPDRYLILEKHL